MNTAQSIRSRLLTPRLEGLGFQARLTRATANREVAHTRAKSQPVVIVAKAIQDDYAIVTAQPEQHVRIVDFLVLGSGIAGLTYALEVAKYGKVAVVAKQALSEGSTVYAQGGVAAVLSENDSVDDHVYDTMVAGDFLNNRKVVEVVCREGPAHVKHLAELGADFTRKRNGNFHLVKEGAHSARRVVHADDATGREIQRALEAKIREHPNIAFYEHHLATDLVLDEIQGTPHCLGVDILDQRSYTMTRFVSPVTIMATGGAGQVYPVTTNPSVSTGDGVAMAIRGGAQVEGMEFYQFHPTGFYSGKQSTSGRTFLISEAVRGEGGQLFSKTTGKRFIPTYDSREELAPRDVVARAIQDQMLTHNDSHVLLDISHCQRDHVMTHFPNIAAECSKHGIDITKEGIPVAPAAHFMCGGVKAGISGETGIKGLFAAGEVASSGLHGANRLASNSLLEGLVFAHRAVQPSVNHADKTLQVGGRALLHAAVHTNFTGSKAPTRLQHSTKEWIDSKRMDVQRLMWENAGIVRRTKDMSNALLRMNSLSFESKALLQTYGISTELVELQNLITVGRTILEGAIARKESRGGHFNADYPFKAKEAPKRTTKGPSQVKNNVKLLGKDSELGRGNSTSRSKSRDVVLRSQKESNA